MRNKKKRVRPNRVEEPNTNGQLNVNDDTQSNMSGSQYTYYTEATDLASSQQVNKTAAAVSSKVVIDMSQSV